MNPLTVEFSEWIQVVMERELLKIFGGESGLKRVDLLFDRVELLIKANVWLGLSVIG